LFAPCAIGPVSVSASTRPGASRFQGPCLVDGQRAAIEFLAVQPIDNGLGVCVGGHLGESESARAIRVRVGLDFGTGAFAAERLEMGRESFRGCFEGQIPDVEALCHDGSILSLM
jgi:hypothetical protein